MIKPYPISFHPILKPRVWGGTSLAEFGKNVPSDGLIGESWELADLPESIENGRSVIANGELSAKTLREAITTHYDMIMGGATLTREGGFPLLIKFLDANENLSVQVHPNEKYVKRHPDAHMKSEAWVVIQAERGAKIYKGLKPGVTRKALEDHIATGDVENDLIALEVQKGDCHYLPSGTCHALGAGIVVAEIQTPSDTTFRVYDWGRTDRELHITQALECIQFNDVADNSTKKRNPIEIDDVRTTVLATCGHFTIERVDALGATSFRIETSGMPEVWMMIEGKAQIDSAGGSTSELKRGTTVLIPAALHSAKISIDSHSWLLRVKLPSPIEGKIAR